ncbi:AAA superfamily ATPase [Pseudomonas knackmussii B13]|uniref:AAA superfamily ATPase n=1 Tax=Pseudomonas knackmussii (strain DSM 6978 / CCUG 54928 / LMG 23759 / B13) TaxID=1301098 RepID=A0A024HH57_PSEKB|nr:ATP-binding protein [Pseudomonas knackmussii]CDF83969.1 AAA superfamily ATPase [Pseudomonas knackmussii B13]
MNQPAPCSNAANLDAAFDVLVRLIRARIKGEELAPDGELRLTFFDDGSPLGTFIRDRQPPFDEYVLLLLALAPHVRPTLLDNEIRTALAREGDFPEIGGVRDEASRTFLPTGETAAFLLAGDNLDGRFEVQQLFSPEHWFAREGVLLLEEARDGAPILSGRIVMARDWVERLTLGTAQAPAFGAGFPARRIGTALDWDDLILETEVQQRIAELEQWVRHHRTLMHDWGMAGRLRPGYRVLFHGPPGTGKTLTATLLGKATGREVYRVDLSSVVSKYIGETEKNLAALFDQARNREWILFFDEADALFGKRTSVKDAHDRYANQEISYLLQRVEEFDGLVILASNFRANIDEAFLRRFNAIIRFPFPAVDERLAIWNRTLPAQTDRECLAGQLARFELSGGNIVNVVQFAALATIAKGRNAIHLDEALLGIQRELEKEGKVFRNLLEEPGA